MQHKNTEVYASISDGAEALALLDIAKNQQCLFVARDDVRMERLKSHLEFFTPQREVLTLPAWDSLPYDRISPHSYITSKRIETLSHLAISRGDNKDRIVITTVNSLLQRVPPWEEIYSSVFQIISGDEINREKLIEFLNNKGFIRVGIVREPGEYAIRGSIMDIFAPGMKEALRLDFFGSLLESIRTFDPLTQMTTGNLPRLDLLPSSEITLDQISIERFRIRYRELFGNTDQDMLYEVISAGRKYAGYENWLPLFYDKLETIFDYVPDSFLCFDYLGFDAVAERLKTIDDYYEARIKAPKKAMGEAAVYNPLPPSMLYLNEVELTHREAIYFSAFASDGAKDLGYKKSHDFYHESLAKKTNPFELLKNNLATKTIVVCATEGTRERMHQMLSEHDIGSTIVNSWGDVKTGISLVILPLETGFYFNDIAFISEQDLLGEKIIRSHRKRAKAEKFFSEIASFAEGELVVHKEHGIGKFEGLETLTVQGNAHDCLKIIYDGGDKLYVPVENIELITRFGSSELEVPLDKLGGVAWQQRKAKIKDRIKEIATELLKIAAERELKPSDILIPTQGLYEEFCSRFPYAETEDQLRTIEEVTEDLASGKPMDRLVCGDVGFGKTEVAMRAAFIITTQEYKSQVSLICPTTLLSRQHYKNFTERFHGMNITIRQISRMVSTKEAAETRKMIEDGTVDIVIGTHALLAKNINFKKLGLLIIDEEQHFGVAQKEKLKALRSDTHVLTLSATPIPRTLQMSLAGVRNLSLITTPPVDRLAVRTFVMPYDPVVTREAILREHYRGGRIFYVCPRVKDIPDLERHLRELVPEVKIAVAHGKKNSDELDQIMNAFYDGKYDLLVSTSIIESGIDIPTANTLIVHRADMFGLAQLYQLRGRVGRSKVRAYAYFTLPHRRTPTKQALKRLEVMQSLDTLGAGFTLATYDMDIRGFGNLLGEEQSGNIKEVGVELYQQMLEEAILKLKSENKESEQIREFSPRILIGASILIPEKYVSDLDVRLGLYKRISNLESDSDIEAMAAELIDRFGKLPIEVAHLLDVVKIQILCRKLNIDKIEAGPKGMTISFFNNYCRNPESLLKYVMQYPLLLKIRADQKLIFLNKSWEEPETRIRSIKEELQKLLSII